MKAAIVGLLVLAVGLVRADGRVCAQSCSVSKDAAVFYEPGKQYRYQYHGDVVTRSRSTNSEASRMAVRSYVIITARTQCDLKLQVMNLAVDDVPPEESQWFRESVEKYDLHFSYTNGMVSYLCPNEEEEVVATNFKRGILSAIQAKLTNMDKTKAIVYEADVLGECETEYEVTQPSEIVVNKTKHNCRYNNHLPYIPHEHYSRKELSGHLPFHSSEQRCVMHLQDRVWSRVECVEEMEMKEFSELFTGTDESSSLNGDSRPSSSLAFVSISTTLVLEAGLEEASEPFTEDGPRKRRESLRMDLDGAIKSADNYRHHDSNVQEEISVTMSYLLASVAHDSGLSEQRPHSFAHLVTLINQLEAEADIDQIWSSYVSVPASRQFILDAAILCETRVCMKLMTRLALEAPQSFPQSRVLAWLTGVHFHTQTHPESVEYLMELARNNMDVEHQAVMAASSVVYRLCQQNRYTCRDNAQSFLDYATEKVGESCGYGQSEDDRHQVMMALRALSNAGLLPKDHFARKCYMNKLMKPDIRRAALQTYRRVSCAEVDFENAFHVLRDVDDDVEVRIAAYLSMVRCSPTKPRFFTDIKQLLLNEEVQQVGSFIWTHVRNLAKNPSGNSHSRELSRLASHHTLQAKFNTNSFRTSKNYRVAQFSKLMNIGGSIDSDIIFTPDSYIPRYESHRFHLDFLENSIDAFEIGGEFKGLEGYLDRLFGKEGYFENEDIQKVMETLRPKRDIHDEKMQEFQMLYDESRTKNELEGSEEGAKTGFYFRIFGNEIFYIDNIFKTNPWLFIQQLVQEFSAPRSFQILKQEFVSPTLLGFPLRFRVNATGSVTYDRTGDLTVNSMTNFHMEGQVSASAAVSMDETLMVEGYGSYSGVRRRSSHVVNTEFGGKLSVQNGKVVDVQFKVPSNELARVSSSVKVSLYENYKQGWNEADYEGPSERHEFCSPDEMRRITGLEFCSTSQHAIIQTDSEETFNGDIYNAEYTLSKTDSFDFYKFYFRNQGKKFEFMFDTPGSTVNRKVALNVNRRPGTVRGTLLIPGKTYDLEGTFENTEALKKVSLLYQTDSTVQGQFEFSLPITQEGSGVHVYTPRILLNINKIFEIDADGTFRRGTDVLSLEGNMKCSLMNNPTNFKASWEREDDQHKIEGNITVGNVFGSTSGTLFLNGEKTLIQLDSEYGTNRNQPKTLTLTFDKTLLIEVGGVRHTGYLSVESSVGNMNVELEYDYGADQARMDTNITVTGTEIISHVIVKNEGDENERDIEVTLSFASPQLQIDYLGQVIYKVSNNAFQGEVEVTLGSSLSTKLALQYLYDNDPLHLQGGVHFHLNDFVVQFVHEIDFSQPDMFLITSSDIIGPAVGVLQVEVFYDRLAPFNATLDVHAGYDDSQFGLKAATSSNDNWSHFDGSVDATWFEWNYAMQHEVHWESNQKKLTLTRPMGNCINVMLQTDPDFLFQFMVQRDLTSDPDIKYVIEKRMDSTSTIYETYLQYYVTEFFHLTATDLGDNTYSGKAKFMESELDLYGQVIQNDEDTTEVQAQATITFPSGNTVKPQISFKHSYDGQVRELQFASHYQEEVIQGQFMMMHKDGWFTDDTRKVSFTITSPFDGLKKIGMGFEAHSDWSEPWFAEAEWEEIKVRGEIQLGDVTNLEAKLEYQDGGTCDSILHFYHKYDGQHFMSGATLGITKAHDPWSFEVITTEGTSSEEQSLDISLTFQSPLHHTPFEAKGKYKLSNEHFSFECEVGSDSKTKLSFSGENETNVETRKLVGALNFDAPWAEPVFLNVENLQDSGSFNVSVDLRTSWEQIHTVGAEFSVNYAAPEETVAHFYLTQQNIQVTMEMVHKLSEQSLVQQIQGSLNSATLNYNLNVNWDENFVSEDSEGQLAINGLFDHNLELSFSHTRDENRFDTKVTGFWDQYQFRANHLLEFDHPLKWSSTLEVNLPEDKITARLFLNSQKDFSSVESTFHFSSSWTEGFTANLEVHGEDKPNEYALEATYGDITLFNVMMHTSDFYQLDKVDISLEISSSLFDNCKLVWQHDFHSGNLVALDFSYGEDFHIEGRSHLKHTQGFFSQEFESYNFACNLKMTNPQLHFKTNFGFNDLPFGEVQVSWYDYLFLIKSSIPENTVFSTSLNYPGDQFHAELLYEQGNSNVPDFSFKYTRNDIDMFSFKGKFSAFYPEFDALLTMYYFNEYTGIPKTGTLHIQADLSHIQEYKFKGMIKLESDFEGFESHWADIDTGMNFTDKVESHFRGQLHMANWQYKTEADCLLNFHPNFQIEYNSAYELFYGDQLFDKKELKLKYNHTKDDIVEGQLTAMPKYDSSPFSISFYFSEPSKEFRGYVIPGNEEKYEVNLNVSQQSVRIKAQKSDEKGGSFNFVSGNINWNLKKVKKQITVNLTSDIAAMKKVTGQLIIQQRKGLAANLKLRVNNNDLTGLLRFVGRGGKNAGKIMIRIDNKIYMPFSTNTSIEYSMKPNEVTANLNMEYNKQKEWVKANVKGSLSESYFRVSLPFEQFKDIDLTVILETETKYGINVDLTGSLACFSFNGSLSRFFDIASVSSKLDLMCSGDALYDFGFRYNFGNDNLIEIGTHLQVKHFGNLFKLDISGTADNLNADFEIETEIYPSHHHTTSLFYKDGQDDDSFEVHTKNLASGETLFLLKIFSALNKKELDIEILNRKIISLSVETKIKVEATTFDAILEHTIFGHPFTAKLTGSKTLTSGSGGFEVHLSTSGSFDHVDLTVNYDMEKDFQGNFHIESSNGNAEGKVKFEKSDAMYSLKCEMQSTLHSFENYQIEALYEFLDDNRNIHIKTMQDEVEFQFNWSKAYMEDMTVLNMNAKMPFENFSSFEIKLGYPEEQLPNHSYEAKIGFMSSNEHYEVHINHMHHESWRNQETRFSINTPFRGIGNYETSFMYDLDGQASLGFKSQRGKFGLGGSWEISDRNAVVELNTDLSFFSEGKYKFKADIPLKIYQKGEFEFSRLQTDLDFDAKLLVDENYRNGELSLNIKPSEDTTTYSISYKYKNRLDIQGQWDSWTVSGRAKFTGSRVSVTSGTIDVTTNFEGFETITGSWDFRVKKKAYSAEVSVDINQQGTIKFDTSFSAQPKGVSRTWEGVVLKMNFDSPFTKNHKLNAEYSIPELKLAVSYQYGSENFEVNLNSTITDRKGSITLSGNVPINGISTFELSFEYNVQNSLKADLKIHIEESSLEFNFEAGSNWMTAQSGVSWSSPFTSPLDFGLKWSFDNYSLNLEASGKYGKQKVGVSMILDYSDTSANFNLKFTMPFRFTYLQFGVKYDFSDSSNKRLSIELKIDEYILILESEQIHLHDQVILKASGSMDILESTGSMTFELEFVDGNYNIEFSGQINNSKHLFIITEMTRSGLLFTVKSGNANIMNVKVDFSMAEVNFAWKDLYLNMTAHYKKTGDSYNVDYDLQSSETHPLSIKAEFTADDTYEGSIKVNHGEKEYNVNGSLSMQKRSSSLNFRFESSENLYNPIVISAKYDISDFLQGRMRSESDLVSLSYEWGEKIQLSLKGQRRGKRMTLNLEIVTPFDLIPELRLGYEGDFVKKGSNIDLNFTAFFEWSERVAITGLLKLKNNKLNSQLTLTTPFSAFENLSFTLKQSNNHLEASLTFNGDEWKTAVDYEFSPKFSVSLTAQTPINGYREISLNTSAEVKNNKFNAKAKLIWENNNRIEMKIVAEMWNLELYLNTPWEPMKDSSFVTSLRTESEELMYNLALKWSSTVADVSIIISPVQSKIEGRYLVNNEEIGKVFFTYHYHNAGMDITSKIELPFESFNLFEVAFNLNLQEKSLKFTATFRQDFHLTMEFMYNRETLNLEGFVEYPQGKTPYTFKMNYAADRPKNAWTGAVEVVSDITWVSIDMYISQEFTVNANFYDNMSMMNLTNSNDEGIQFGFHVIPQGHFDLDSLDLLVTFNYDKEFDGSVSLIHKSIKLGNGRHELKWQGSVDNSLVSVTLTFDSDHMNKIYDLVINFPLNNIFQNDSKIGVKFGADGEEHFKFSYDMTYPQRKTFNHVINVQFSDWTAEFSASLTRSNFQVYFFFPNEETKHTLVVSWPRDISLEKLTLQMEVSTPYLKDGDISCVVNFNVQEKFHFTLTSSLSYGSNSLEMNSKFQYNKKQRKVVFETAVISDWIGNYSATMNIGWLRNINVDFKLMAMEQEHIAKLQIDRQEYTAEFIINSPWISSEELKITGMVNKDLQSTNILVEAKLTSNSDEYSIEGKFESTEEKFINVFFVMKRGYEDVLRVSGVFQLKDDLIELDFNLGSDVKDISSFLKFNYEDNEEKRALTVNFSNSYYKYVSFYLDILSNKEWRKEQRLYINFMNWVSFTTKVDLGEEEGEVNLYFYLDDSKFNFEFEYDINEEFELEVHLKTPFNTVELFNFELEWPLKTDSKKELNFYYQWYDDNISFKFDLRPDSITGWSINAYLTTPFEGYEKFGLQTPQFESKGVYNFLVEFPEKKVGLEMSSECSHIEHCTFRYSLHLPFEEYEIISLQFSPRLVNGFIIEARVGKIGFTLSINSLTEEGYYQFGTLLRINEYKTESYIRIYRHRFRVQFHTDFEMQDIADVKSFDIECRYDPRERILILAKTDKEELIKMHMGWGTDKVVAITTPKVYPGYLILNLESSEYVENIQIEIGIRGRSYDKTWDTYGFHIQQKQLGYGRDLHISAEAGQSQFSIEGTITLNPMYNDDFYIKNRLFVEMNHKKIGFVTYFHADSGLFENSYNGDLQIIVPEQALHWDTNATCTGGSFDLLSRFRWNDFDNEEEPITLTIDYDDLSAISNVHILQAIVSHPQIQNITLQGNLTHTDDSMLFVMAEFVDENNPEKTLLFKMNSQSEPESGLCIIKANITQPSSNFAIGLDAEIAESVFNRASYVVSYWSHSENKWEFVDLTTGIESLEHGWNFTANINKSDSNWGYNYNGSLLHQNEYFSFNIMGVSKHFMDYWKLETSINKIMPELDMQLQVGQSKLEPHEIGRVRAGLHNPLELGIIVDHERFGVWRQDARAGLRLRNQDLLQFIVEYDPSYDFTAESIIYRLTSPANKISHNWLRDLSYTASTHNRWASSEIHQVLEVIFNQETLQTILNYGKNKYVVFESAMLSSMSTFYESFDQSYTQTIKPFLDSSYNQAIDMYASVQPYFDNAAFVFQENWTYLVEFIDIEYVKFHDQLIMDFDRFYLWWTETNHEMNVAFKNMMYEMVRAMNTFSSILSETLRVLQDKFGPTFDRYRMVFERYGRELEAVFGGQCWPRLQLEMDKIRASLAEISYMAEQFINPAKYFRQWQIFQAAVVDFHNNNRQTFEDGLSLLQDALRQSEVFGELINEYEHVRHFISDVMRDGFYVTFQRKFSEVGPQIVAQADETVRFLRVKYSELQEYSRGNIVFDYFDAVTANTFERMVLTWEQWRSNEYQVLEVFQRFFVSFVDGFKKLVQEGASLAEESIIFEPKSQGKIIYNQYLPVPWNSFLESPQWFRLVNIFKKESPISESKRKLFEGVDRVNSVSNALSLPNSMIPPFTATATVYGQQITTFDLLHYQFLGSCTYLMAKDFVGGDFEIIGDYSRSDNGEIMLKSLIIRAQGADVTLNVDGTFDATNMGSAQVINEGNYVAFKQGSLFVTCNKKSQGCSVTVGSKYFGRLAGLFGNYNYEPSDDSMGPDGSKGQEGNDIANSWAVSSHTCYQANQVRTVTELSHTNNVGSCHELFLRSSSPFSRCFMRIDPRPYFWHCVRDLKRPNFNQEHQHSPCDSAAAYRTQCATRNVHMQPLLQCPRVGEGMKQTTVPPVERTTTAPATCDVSGETVSEGWSNTYEGESQGSADVAFVIEIANCNKDRNLQLLLRLIKVQLKRSGIQDVRYALVTTQGDSVEVPSEMVSEDEFNTQLGSVVAEGPKSDNGGAEAVRAAARQLKWRPGVSRNIIQLPCRACDEGESVTEALSENDVTYHILTKFMIAMNGPNAKKSKAMANKVYGFDSKRMYTPKDTKKFTGNVNMRKLFQDPEGSSCFEAAQTSGGSVFNVNKWTSKSAVVEKKYLGVIGQRVLKSTNAPECQECRCLRKSDDAHVSCRKCGEEWPAIEHPAQQQVASSRRSESVHVEDRETDGAVRDYRYENREDESKSVMQDIRQSFKEQFIENNAAFAQIEQNQDGEEESDRGREYEEEEEQHHGREHEEQEEQEEDSDESNESEDYDGNYQYQDYSYQDYNY